MNLYDTYDCPQCGGDWRDGEIPEDKRETYGEATHFSKLIGIYDSHRDRTVEWMCPYCRHRWPRS